jgi:hypothetical protein
MAGIMFVFIRKLVGNGGDDTKIGLYPVRASSGDVRRYGDMEIITYLI